MPGNKPEKRYCPRSSLTVVCTARVPVLVIVTFAPGRTPPLVSSTVPRTVAVVDWPKVGVVVSNHATQAAAKPRTTRKNLVERARNMVLL